MLSAFFSAGLAVNLVLARLRRRRQLAQHRCRRRLLLQRPPHPSCADVSAHGMAAPISFPSFPEFEGMRSFPTTLSSVSSRT